MGDGFAWRRHGYGENPVRGNWVLAAILGTGAIVTLGLHSSELGLVACLGLVASTAGFFLPRRYRLSSEGLVVGTVAGEHLHRWRDLRSVQVRGSRVWLSRYPAGGYLSRLRSVQMDLPLERAEEVLVHVRACIERRP